MDKPILIKDLGMLFPTEKSKKKARYGLYRCFCGNEFRTTSQSVKSGKRINCGCLRNKDKIKHGLKNHRLYRTWQNMISRCYNTKSTSYKYYGELGIKVCDRWHNVSNFIDDMYPSYEEGLTLDRINTSGSYELSNCRWATKLTQGRNTKKLMNTNKSGYRGVHWSKIANKWQAKIVISSKTIHLGYYKSAIDGAKAYDYYVLENNLEHTINNVGI